MIALLLVALLASTLATDASFRALRRLARKKPVVRLSPRAFAEYIDSGPKNYSTVIELTSTGHSFPCAECRYALSTTQSRWPAACHAHWRCANVDGAAGRQACARRV